MVYDRKKHEFQIIDAIRILKTINPLEEERSFETFACFFEAFLIAYGMMETALFHLPWRANMREIAGALIKVSQVYIKTLKFFYRRIPEVVLSIIMSFIKEFISPEVEDGKEVSD